ncbi:MAG: alpha/beta hydrolase [Pseudomonadota bacterium]
MSIRASALSFFLKRTLKKQMASFEDPIAMRARASSGFGRTPKEVQLEAIDAGGVAAQWVRYPGAATDAALLYLHGGGYVFGGLESHRDIAWRLSRAAGLNALVVDYRLAPEHPFPGAVEDATASFLWLLAQGFSPDRILVAGDSAGGGLAVALMLRLKELNHPLPKAAVLMSPWVDMAMTGASMTANADADVMLSPGAMSRFATHYLGSTDPRTALASPLYGDLSGLPPVQVLVGSTEVLLSDSEALVQHITAAGGQAQLHVWPNMPHVFPIFASILPEARAAIEEMARFMRTQLPSG